jgi:hypothetical protein
MSAWSIISLILVPAFLVLAARSWFGQKAAKRAASAKETKGRLFSTWGLHPTWKRSSPDNAGVGDIVFAIDHRGAVRAEIRRYWIMEIPGMKEPADSVWEVAFPGRPRGEFPARLETRDLAEKWVEENWLDILQGGGGGTNGN